MNTEKPELITPDHPAMSARPGSPCFSINGREVSFDANTVRDFKLTNDPIFFLREDKNLFFYQGKGKGFPVIQKGNSPALKIMRKPLVNFLRKTFKLSMTEKTMKFYVQQTEKTHDDNKLFEILIDKSIKQFGK